MDTQTNKERLRTFVQRYSTIERKSGKEEKEVEEVKEEKDMIKEEEKNNYRTC